MSIWKKTNGSIVKTSSGRIVTCDDCPCGELCIATYPSSLTIMGVDGTGCPGFTPGCTWPVVNNIVVCGGAPINPCVYGGVDADGNQWYNILIQAGVPRVLFERYSDPPPLCGGGSLTTRLGTHNPFGTWIHLGNEFFVS